MLELFAIRPVPKSKCRIAAKVSLAVSSASKLRWEAVTTTTTTSLLLHHHSLARASAASALGRRVASQERLGFAHSILPKPPSRSQCGEQVFALPATDLHEGKGRSLSVKCCAAGRKEAHRKLDLVVLTD